MADDIPPKAPLTLVTAATEPGHEAAARVREIAELRRQAERIMTDRTKPNGVNLPMAAFTEEDILLFCGEVDRLTEEVERLRAVTRPVVTP